MADPSCLVTFVKAQLEAWLSTSLLFFCDRAVWSLRTRSCGEMVEERRNCKVSAPLPRPAP